jgi:hypothetical protein
VIRHVTEADLPEKFHALLRTTGKFRLSWQRKRSDLNDLSLSGFEQSLASLAAHQNFSAQEIVDVLVVFRTKWKGSWHGRSYYRATVGKALANAARHRRDQREGAFYVAQEEGKEKPNRTDENQADEAATEDAPETPRQKLLEELNRAVVFAKRRLHFANVIRRGSCFVAFDCLGHEIPLGTPRSASFDLTEVTGGELTDGRRVAVTGVTRSAFMGVIGQLRPALGRARVRSVSDQ